MNKKIYTPLAKRLNNLQGNHGNIYICEVLEELPRLVNNEERVELLKLYASKKDMYKKTLFFVFKFLFHKDWVMDLPISDPEYKKNTAIDETFCSKNLFNVLGRMGYFVKSHPNYVAEEKRRCILFIRTLELLSAREAKLLLCMKDKDFVNTEYPKFNRALAVAAFPEWFEDETEKK